MLTYRWLGKWHLSEAKERELCKELVGDDIESEAVPLTFSIDGAGVERKCVKPRWPTYTRWCQGWRGSASGPDGLPIPDLVKKVVQLLDQNDKYTSHTHTHRGYYL